MDKFGISAAISFAVFLALSSASPIQIQAGFELIGTVEGKIFVMPIVGPGSDNMTYQEAISKCQSAGYRIATLESPAQNEIVQEIAWRWSWIDGIDLLIPDVFFSINTGKNLTYTNWTVWGQRPVIGKDDRNCVRISCNSFDCGWWDVNCNDKYSVICELPVGI
ncbi:unnamed protein product [Orchesella dallaii]|uniref:C-type lectin domain-containing protein n=1 Tax=Orchesella dallaii TaxID=48710 RepID=A0ABP1R6W7_9HEXA